MSILYSSPQSPRVIGSASEEVGVIIPLPPWFSAGHRVMIAMLLEKLYRKDETVMVTASSEQEYFPPCQKCLHNLETKVWPVLLLPLISQNSKKAWMNKYGEI